jgi:hypothetical protein
VSWFQLDGRAHGGLQYLRIPWLKASHHLWPNRDPNDKRRNANCDQPTERETLWLSKRLFRQGHRFLHLDPGIGNVVQALPGIFPQASS